LEDGALTPLEAASVSCLGCYEQQCYACTRDRILPLDAAGLGAASFDLSKLVPPTLTGLDQETATSCDLQWQHLHFDMLAFDASLQAPAANSSNVIAATGGVSGAPRVGGAGAAGSAPKPAADGGCSAPLGGLTGSDALALVALVLSRGLRRRRR
jgi:hypothetical protein